MGPLQPLLPIEKLGLVTPVCPPPVRRMTQLAPEADSTWKRPVYQPGLGLPEGTGAGGSSTYITANQTNGVGVGAAVGGGVGVGVRTGVGVAVRTGVRAGVRVGVAVGFGVGLGVAFGVACGVS